MSLLWFSTKYEKADANVNSSELIVSLRWVLVFHGLIVYLDPNY